MTETTGEGCDLVSWTIVLSVCSVCCERTGSQLSEGTTDLFLQLSGQRNACRPTSSHSEKRFNQVGFRISKEAVAGTRLSRGGVSVKCIKKKKSKLGSLRARFVPNEFRTIGELRDDEKIASDSEIAWTSPQKDLYHGAAQLFHACFHLQVT